MADYTAWYRVGTVALTTGSKIVTGTDTYWLSAGLHQGDIFSTDNVTDYEIQSVDSNTQLTLKTAYAGASTTEAAYSIVRNFTATMAAQVAANTANLLNDMRRYIDADMQSIHGKSAYQIACEKGFAGTESEWVESLTAYGVAKSNGYTGTLVQWLASLKGDSAYDVAVQNGFNGTIQAWLESLKADNEWATLDERTELLKMDAHLMSIAAIKNVLYRGKNLGEFTATDYTNVRNGTFNRMWLGDYFTFPGDTQKYRIAGFDWLRGYHIGTYPGGRHTMTIVPDGTVSAKVDVDGTEVTLNCYGHAAGTFGEDDPGNTSCCYPQSTWYTKIMPVFVAKMEEYFTKLQSFKIDVSASCNTSTGAATSRVSLDAKAHLMTFDMLGGTNYWFPLRTAPRTGQHYCTFDTLPIFKVQPWHFTLHDGSYALADCTASGGTIYPYTMSHEFDISTRGWNTGVRPIFNVGGM